MLIKQVTIQGFKTFAVRTDFVFDPGVTAIVGPNGSGKSNIVDAIRWCLGEQSFSLIRSKKTEDVIFAGSDNRSRLGMAEVRLTLDNSAGELPIDFAEIEIARRAYRDGGNEYLLNGKRVRLADVTNLLAQTGLGRRTYALIGQGLIDRVLSLAPEELRSLFEEAAGITAYQSKRVATLRQLDAAHNNLLRIQDILTELTPRLSSLRRQATRARERDEIARDLQSFLRVWYGYHWHTSQRRLDLNRIEAQRQKESVLSLRQRLSKIDAKIASIRTEQATIRAQLATLHHTSSDLHRTAELDGKRLAVAQERLRQLRVRREEYTQEVAPLQQRRDALQSRAQSLRTTISLSEKNFAALTTSADAVYAKVEEQRRQRGQKLEQVAQARDTVSNLRSEVSATSARIDQFKSRIEGLHAELADQTVLIGATSTRAAMLAAEIDEASKVQNSTQQEIAREEGALAILEQQAQTLDTELSDVQTRIQTVERDQERSMNRQEMLQRLHDDGAGYASGVRSVLQAANPDRAHPKSGRKPLRGVLGTVASLIHVSESLDKAMEIALGAAYQNIVVETWDHARLAIDYLQASGKGRATFLPLNRLHVSTLIAAPKHDGVIGNAAELVTCDTHLLPVVQHLLNRTWIVQDLPVARTELDQIRGSPRPTVVTLSGDVVRPGGAVTGGSDHTRRDDSVLSRERELRQLPQQIRQISETRSALASEYDQLTERIHRLQLDSDAVRSRVATHRSKFNDQRSDGDRLANLYAQARQTQEWSEGRYNELTAELASIQSNCTQSEDALVANELRLAEATRTLTELEKTSPQTDQDALQAQLTEVRTNIAKAETEVASKQTLLREHEVGLSTVTEQIQAKRKQIESAEDEERQLVVTIAELEKEEQNLSRQIGELQVRISPLEHQLQRLESVQESDDNTERQLKEELRKQETAWNSIQLQLQRSQDSIEQLRKNIENDLGLVLWDSGQEDDVQPPLPWATIVEQLPQVDELPENMEEDVRNRRARLSRVSNVNPDAPREYEEVAERHTHLSEESADLESAITDLRKVLRELDLIMEAELDRTFSAVSKEFVTFFETLFSGGSARLVLAEPNDIANSGIEIIARPPGKRPQTLALLSGGERTLTACALIFAILKVSPTPFCVLDEVDAALDEANVDRFRRVIDMLCGGTQFILITHNRRTLEGTSAIYGITLGNDGASRVISLRLQGDKIVNNNDGETDSSQQALEEIETIVQM